MCVYARRSFIYCRFCTEIETLDYRMSIFWLTTFVNNMCKNALLPGSCVILTWAFNSSLFYIYLVSRNNNILVSHRIMAAIRIQRGFHVLKKIKKTYHLLQYS